MAALTRRRTSEAVAPAAIDKVEKTSCGVTSADFDNDGWEEIFVNNIPGSNRLFQKTSVGGEWAWRNIGDALEPMGYGTGAAVVDFDGDGRLELVV